MDTRPREREGSASERERERLRNKEIKDTGPREREGSAASSRIRHCAHAHPAFERRKGGSAFRADACVRGYDAARAHARAHARARV